MQINADFKNTRTCARGKNEEMHKDSLALHASCPLLFISPTLHPRQKAPTMYLRTATLLTAALSLFSTASAKSAVLDLLPGNFDEVVLNSGKPALVEFFAPWCGHCKTLAPIYEELGAAFEHAKGKVSIAKVDADEHRELGTRFGVSGFPTLKWFDGKSAKPIVYSSGRDLDSLKKFVEEKTGLKGRGKKTAPSDVEILTDSTFSSVVGKDKDVLVAFTAPWCGRMSSTPIWPSVS